MAHDADSTAKGAKTTADEAKTKADAVGVEADQVQVKIAGVDRRADVLAHILSARRIQDEDGLKNDLERKYAGSHIAFDSYAGDQEAYWRCSQLAQIAHKAGVDARDGCATRPMAQVPISDLHISAPTIDEGQRLSMVLMSPNRVPGHFVSLNVGPEVVVTVGVKPPIPLAPMVKKATSKKSAKPL